MDADLPVVMDVVVADDHAGADLDSGGGVGADLVTFDDPVTTSPASYHTELQRRLVVLDGQTAHDHIGDGIVHIVRMECEGETPSAVEHSPFHAHELVACARLHLDARVHPRTEHVGCAGRRIVEEGSEVIVRVDLDGPALLARDREDGFRFEEGRISGPPAQA